MFPITKEITMVPKACITGKTESIIMGTRYVWAKISCVMLKVAKTQSDRRKMLSQL